MTFPVWAVDSVHMRFLLKSQFEEYLVTHLTSDAVVLAGSSATVGVVCKVHLPPFLCLHVDAAVTNSLLFCNGNGRLRREALTFCFSHSPDTQHCMSHPYCSELLSLRKEEQNIPENRAKNRDGKSCYFFSENYIA